MSEDAQYVIHDGPGHPYGDPSYCGGCWWEQIGRYKTSDVTVTAETTAEEEDG